jgi:glycosyltransferase involved in cell wall biosynthesis
VIAAFKEMRHPVRLVVTGPPGPHNPKNDEYVRELLALREKLDVTQEVVFLMEAWQDAAGLPRTLSDETIADLYRAADMLFFPSTQEGFGLPIIEAGLTRLPIFCTRLAPFEEIAGDTLSYFEPSDPPEKIARQIIEECSANRQFRLCRQVLENYTWESIFENQIIPLA